MILPDSCAGTRNGPALFHALPGPHIVRVLGETFGQLGDVCREVDMARVDRSVRRAVSFVLANDWQDRQPNRRTLSGLRRRAESVIVVSDRKDKRPGIVPQRGTTARV